MTMLWFLLGWKLSTLGGNTIWYRGVELHDPKMQGIVELASQHTGWYFSIDIK